MKRMLCLMMALCLLVLAVPALAEAGEAAPTALPAGEALAIDLDGDGAQETVAWEMAHGEYDDVLTLTVTSKDGTELRYATDILWGEAVYVVDLDGDGAQEILMSGDVMSDDYCTWCLHYAQGALHEVLFPDADRGDNNTAGYYRMGYGLITSIEGNALTLTGTQDVLGTWMAARTVTLTPWDRFEFSDDGRWQRYLSDPDDPELWSYAALTLKAPVAWLNGPDAEAGGTLQPGDRIIVYASDKREWAWFTTQDGGVNGVLAISPDYERGWGWLVDGTPEEDCFEVIPYAD